MGFAECGSAFLDAQERLWPCLPSGKGEVLWSFQDTPTFDFEVSSKAIDTMGQFQLKELLETVSALIHHWCCQVQSKLFHVTFT